MVPCWNNDIRDWTIPCNWNRLDPDPVDLVGVRDERERLGADNFRQLSAVEVDFVAPLPPGGVSNFRLPRWTRPSHQTPRARDHTCKKLGFSVQFFPETVPLETLEAKEPMVQPIIMLIKRMSGISVLIFYCSKRELWFIQTGINKIDEFFIKIWPIFDWPIKLEHFRLGWVR